ncbi:hypothetical protein HK096_005117 [Nowakowskiella sp. JEL0078]|nr:hypothetical protein HK096_005117 [Nowakowskiella sp. JEL0078]
MVGRIVNVNCEFLDDVLRGFCEIGEGSIGRGSRRVTTRRASSVGDTVLEVVVVVDVIGRVAEVT